MPTCIQHICMDALIHECRHTYIQSQRCVSLYTYIYKYKHMHGLLHVWLYPYTQRHLCVLDTDRQSCLSTYVHSYTHKCIHTHIHIYVHTYMNTYINTSIHTDIHACLSIYILYLHRNMHAYTHACLATYINAHWTYINAHWCMSVYIQTYLHACIHTCMHACIHAYIHGESHVPITDGQTLMFVCLQIFIHIYTYIHVLDILMEIQKSGNSGKMVIRTFLNYTYLLWFSILYCYLYNSQLVTGSIFSQISTIPMDLFLMCYDCFHQIMISLL